MKKNYFTKVLVLTLSAATVMQIPAYAVTKAELEASGKVPYSVDYRYQQDYLDGKDVPESALNYEKMVTKSQLEAAGKGPDSVNWRYQEDYLANKPIPESALIYKQKTQQSTANASGEKMVTKSQLEAAGKGPDSVNWRYQQDYLANKPIPESALIYKPKTNKSSSSSKSSSSKSSSSTPNQLFGDKNNKGVFDEIFSPLTDLYKGIFGEEAYNKSRGWD